MDALNVEQCAVTALQYHVECLQVSGREALGLGSIVRKLILFYPPSVLVGIPQELLQR